MTGDPSQTNDPSANQPLGHERFQVLALDGGGAKALFTAHVLARMEADLGVSVIESFDLIAGTSVGGVIALGLGAGIRPADLVERCADLTKRVFSRSRQARWRLLPRAWGPAYSGDVLREVLGEVFGSRLFGESAKRLVIPSWDVQRGEVHLFKTPHHERLRRDGHISVADVAMATTAMPTFFPAAEVDGRRLIDGGVWANNPSVVAIGEAVSMLGVPLQAIRVLNVGAVGRGTNHPDRLDSGGWTTWASSAASLMITATSRGTQGTAIHLVGKENFTRFDINVPGDAFTSDRASSGGLIGLAASQSRVLSPVYAGRFADHIASPYIPTFRSGSAPATPTSPGGAS